MKLDRRLRLNATRTRLDVVLLASRKVALSLFLLVSLLALSESKQSVSTLTEILILHVDWAGHA